MRRTFTPGRVVSWPSWTKLVTVPLVAGLVASTSVVALGQSAGAAGSSTVILGNLTALTGSCAAPTTAVAHGIELAVKEINAKGFVVAGKRYRFKLEQANTATDNTTGVASMLKLVKTDGAKMVVGPGCASYTEPGLSPLAEKEGILFFAPFQGATLTGTTAKVKAVADGKGYLLPVAQASSGQSTAAQVSLIKAAFPKTDSISKVYVLLEDTQEGHTFGSVMTTWFKSHGYHLTLTYYPTTTQDFSGYVSAVKASGAQLLLYGYGDPSALAILKQAVAINAAPNYYGWGNSLTDPININGTSGITAPQLTLVYPTALQYPRDTGIRAFAAKYKSFLGGKLTSDSSYAAYLYTDPFLLVAAMQKAKTTTNLKAIAKALYHIHHKGLLSSNEYFDSTHHLHFDITGCLVKPGPNPAQHVTCTPVKQ